MSAWISKIRMAVASAAIGAAYVLWPYWSADQLHTALESSDVATISRTIERPSLRASIKEMLIGEMMKDTLSRGSSKSNAEVLGTGFAPMLAPAMVDRMVDPMVSPHGLASLVAGQPTTGNSAKFRSDFVRRATFTGPTGLRWNCGAKRAEAKNDRRVGAYRL